MNDEFDKWMKDQFQLTDSDDPRKQLFAYGDMLAAFEEGFRSGQECGL